MDAMAQDEETISLDHKNPISLGGGNDIENLILCHNKCNLVKGTIDYELFTHAIRSIREKYGQNGVRRFISTGYIGAKANKLARKSEVINESN